jgi:DNA-binding winged helix-turn-helix (wHTH) protein
VDVHVRRLRAKLGPEHEALIGTVRNVGYRFVPVRTERAERSAASGGEDQSRTGHAAPGGGEDRSRTGHAAAGMRAIGSRAPAG